MRSWLARLLPFPSRFLVTASDLFQNGSIGVTIRDKVSDDHTYSVSASAGQFTVLTKDLSTGISQSLQGYCTDIFDGLSLGATYNVGLLSDSVTNPTKLGQIKALLANGNSLIQSAAGSDERSA